MSLASFGEESVTIGPLSRASKFYFVKKKFKIFLIYAKNRPFLALKDRKTSFEYRSENPTEVVQEMWKFWMFEKKMVTMFLNFFNFFFNSKMMKS